MQSLRNGLSLAWLRSQTDQCLNLCSDTSCHPGQVASPSVSFLSCKLEIIPTSWVNVHIELMSVKLVIWNKCLKILSTGI